MSSIDRILEGQMLDESVWLEFGEFCASLQVERHWVAELVDAGVLEPRGPSPDAVVVPGQRTRASAGHVATGQRPRREPRGRSADPRPARGTAAARAPPRGPRAIAGALSAADQPIAAPSRLPISQVTTPAPPPISTMRNPPRQARRPVNRLSAAPTPNSAMPATTAGDDHRASSGNPSRNGTSGNTRAGREGEE